MSTRTALFLVAAGLLVLLAVNAGDRFLKVLMRYRLVSFVWRVSRTMIFAAWSSAFLLLAAGLILIVFGVVGDVANQLFELLIRYRFAFLGAVFVGSLLYFIWWRHGYPWKEE